jgi:hypothetical protein
MKVNSPAFVLFLIASFFAILGVAIDNEFIVLLSKPVIAPAIFFHYIQIKRGPVNWLFFMAIFCSFVADMIVVFQMSEGDIPIAFLNICMYLIFTYFVIKDLEKENITIFRFFYFLLIVCLYLAVLYVILDLMTGLDSFMFNIFVLYGLILSVLSAIIGFNYINRHCGRTFYALLMCICFIVSDVFFAIYNFYLKIEIFILFNLFAQFTSYYFMVKYFTSKSILQEIKR